MDVVFGTAEIRQGEIDLNASLALSSTVYFLANEWAAGSAQIWPDGSIGVTGPTGSYDNDYYIKRAAQATSDSATAQAAGKIRAEFYTGTINGITERTVIGHAVVSATDLHNV